MVLTFISTGVFNALSDVVTGDIVVMANADMVFDSSIAKAKKLKEDVLLVLGTWGFSTDATPTDKNIL